MHLIITQLLYEEWASFGLWYKRQPLWLIRNYFGAKIGLYFAWLGFYTQMLILPAIIGLLVIMFGLVTINTRLNRTRYLFYLILNSNIPIADIKDKLIINHKILRNSNFSTEICDMSEGGFGNITMCPICDKYCDFWKLSDSCFNSKIAYLFDNAATVLWSIFMTVWGKIMNSEINRYILLSH